MFDSFFRGLFDAEAEAVIAPGDFLLCIGCALLVGVMLAAAYAYKTRYTKSFLMTMVLLPVVVCVVIMLVNGNVGTGVAVAGAFSLVRFRSVPGTAKEITMLFLAMGAGLIVGMGYLGYALLFGALMCLLLVLFTALNVGSKRNIACCKVLNVTIPEDLDYTGIFDDIFEEFTTECQMVRVKTTNMGSLFRLTYELTLKDEAREKEMIDQLRCRNGNLEITVSRQETGTNLL